MRNKALKQLTIRAEACRPAKGGGFILSGSTVALELLLAPRCFLVHGWQSWSLTAWLETSRRMPAMQPALMRPMQTDPVHVDDERLNGSWYGAVEMDDGQVVFLGALGLDSHVALEGDSLKGWYEISGGEWFLATGDEQQIMTHYAELLMERFGKGRVRKPHHVWCSWYSLYTEIYEQQLFKILADLDDLPFDVFQIDDGWQKKVGDWEPNDKFPSGMQAMADQIRATGRIPGLWLAPLLVVPSSSLYRQHRDWL